MKKQRRTMNRKSLLMLLVLLTAVVLLATGCQPAPKKEEATVAPVETIASQEKKAEETAQAPEDVAKEETGVEITEAPVIIEKEIGEGATSFSFQVTFKDGTSNYYLVHTDEENVGKALIKEKLIEGSQGEFGLYVLTVDGETLDYDKDKMYWAFYVNSEYATAGVDQTAIEADALYQFKAEK